MSLLTKLEDIFCNQNDLTLSKLQSFVGDSLYNNVDDGELFLEDTITESLVFDENILKNSSFNHFQGFGLRGVIDEATAYSHSSQINLRNLQNAQSTIYSLKKGVKDIKINLDKADIAKDYKSFYPQSELAPGLSTIDKIKILQNINEYLRSRDSKVTQVSVSMGFEHQNVMIIKQNQDIAYDVRPLFRLNISVVLNDKGRIEKGSSGFGGRDLYSNYLTEEKWKKLADKAYEEAVVNLQAVDSPAGVMDVVLGSGWPGVLLHEAVGHGLEGDFNRKKTSVFSNLIGEKVAASGVTVVDDGTIENRRGSLNIDDEGMKTKRNVLIEDGILKGYMFDRLNARLMGKESTGSGRRESYECVPMPRMTNTFMLSGKYAKDEIIKNVKKGIYAVNFSGGQVDITSGQFVFSTSECYLIENGKITTPIKGVTLIGSGADALKKISMIGDDLALDDGIGTCGKNGQSVPVGVGMPTILINNLTVGGTKL